MARRAFAQEDTNISTVTIATARQKEYQDIDLTFQAKPVSGEIFKKTSAAAVKQAVKNIVQTNFLEKPFLPDFGGDIRSQLFELSTNTDDMIIRENIISTVEQYEPRAEILDIKTNLLPDYNSLSVTVTFKVVNIEEVVEFTTTVSRLR